MDPFQSDEFSAATLGSRWESVTPHGVGSVQMAHSGSGEGWLALSVPAGVNHDPWADNEAVRAVQAVPDGDLSLAAGFASMPFQRYQMQGLLVASTSTSFLRYGFHHDGSGLRLFASTTVRGTPSVLVDEKLPPELADTGAHLRVARVGHEWTLSWSGDGATWSVSARFSSPMMPAEVGPFAGNYDAAGNAPAFTALVDYVVETSRPVTASQPVVNLTDTAPPLVTGASPDTRPVSTRLSWRTDEVTTGVVEYGPTEQYGEVAEATVPGTGHGVTLTGLDPATRYHYRLVATDLSGNASTTTGTFTTNRVGDPAPLRSDEFDEPQLGPHWTKMRPLRSGTVVVTDGELALSVPAGADHHPWAVNHALRAVQAVADSDLNVTARFTSMPTERYQLQGLTVGESRVTFLRYEVHHDGNGLRLFALATVDGAPTVVVNAPLPELAAVSLRMVRRFDDWDLSWSADGESWTSAASFTQRMVVTEFGPFAGSHGGDGAAPAFTARVDQVLAKGKPAGPGGDAPPRLAVSDVSVDTTTNHTPVSWVTSRDATAHVEYGPDDSYGATTDTTVAGTRHRLLLTDLALDTTYHYRIVATGSDGETVRSKDATFTTAATNTGPTIDLWYGQEQPIGPAQSQEWVNVLGNVSDPDGVSSLSYSLNGGGSRPLSLGPDERRLQWPGDFNADIPADELRSGENLVTLTATDALGLVTTTTVTLRQQSGDRPDVPLELPWRADRSPADQVQVVDGKWTVGEDGLRTDATGYDRVVAVGDVGWTDYQLTVPITVYELGPAAYTRYSGGPMIGVGLRWQGHSVVDRRQPAWGYYPVGAFAWYRFHENGPRFELSGNEGQPDEHGSLSLEMGTTYLLKVRVETVGEATQYQAKLWPQSGPEPGFWMLEITDEDGPGSGAVALIAHQLHGSFGDVTVEPL